MVFVHTLHNHQFIENMISSSKLRFLLFIFTWLSLANIYGSEHTPAYIQQYKTIVQQEMDRAAIPASIKMAQAILESASGRSTLARQSNNHFGIKCGKNWTGGEVYRHDDDYKNGLLVRSCFRAYDDPAKSFVAHSDFLTSNRRYGFLFELDIYDYKGWANGLKKAGYATDPKYPSKLIGIIEKYELYLLDLGIDTSEPIIASAEEERTTIDTAPRDEKEEKATYSTDTYKPARLRKKAGKKEERKAKRERKKRTKKEAKRKSKRKTKSSKSSSKRAKKKKGTHIVSVGENMTAIAAKYKMPIRDLYFKNRLAYGTQPAVGTVLSIEKYINFGKRPGVAKGQAGTKDVYLFEESITISSL